MNLSRRSFIKGTAATALAPAIAAPFVRRAFGADPIKIAAIYDLSGGLDIVGKPMLETLNYALSEINAAGGLLGSPVEAIVYDTQSSMQLYAQFAQQAALSDKVASVHGGITSASREVIRPVLDRYKALYFYDMPYEGGVCDRNIFISGVTPAHNVDKLVKHGIETYGPKVYVIAADYNYGQITTDWVRKYAADFGGEVLGSEFFPLDASNFGSTISKIQAAAPDWVMSILVGGPTISFYRQYAATGLNKTIPVSSTTFSTTEALVLGQDEYEGLTVCQNYVEDIQNPVNEAFLAGYRAMYPDALPVTELAMSSYQGIHLWAEGVKKAGSIDRMAVIEALEDGMTLAMPSGEVTLDPKTHHCVLDIHLAQYQSGQLKVLTPFPAQPPADTAAVCDLIANPNDNQQYIIDV
jgi:urea transport system substrate-binding protein